MQFVCANDTTDNITLASAEDSVLSAPSETKSYTDLKAVIDAASDGDEIILDFNYKYIENDPKSGINITKNLIINGNGAVIDGASASSLFNISGGKTVTLKNLTIQNAGGIYHDWFVQTVTPLHAIYSEGNLNFIDCTFENCVVNDYSSPIINGSLFNGKYCN